MPTRRIVITFDASALTEPDEAVLDQVARLLLAARRSGVSVEFHHTPRHLADLLVLVGLADDLLVEPGGQAEEREQVRVDKEVDPGDPVV